MSENKIKPSSISDSERVGIFLKWVGFCFCMQTDTVLLVTLTCEKSAVEVSALPNTQFYKAAQGSMCILVPSMSHPSGSVNGRSGNKLQTPT